MTEPGGTGFADIFSQPAWVKICASRNDVEIKLRESRSLTDTPILWLGVIEGDEIPAHDTEWEILKLISETQIAFAALVR